MIELKGRVVGKTVANEHGSSVLELAMKYKIDWGFSCTRGSCARCRCLVTAGMDELSEPNRAETDRLEPEEIAEGYRLGCQARIVGDGDVTAVLRTYF
jgi:2Fe-2S ferredoxin